MFDSITTILQLDHEFLITNFQGNLYTLDINIGSRSLFNRQRPIILSGELFLAAIYRNTTKFH